MPSITGKHALMQMLRAEGVEYIFGNPGTSESPIMDAIESYPELKYVLGLQEGVVMGMADAYARASGKPSFVNLHIETGLANGISLLHNANQSGTPLVLSAGNKDIRELAHGRTDLAGMVRQFTKWSAEAAHPDSIPLAIQRAFKEAKTPPKGPSFVSFSANALDDETSVDIIASPGLYHNIAPDDKAVEDATRILCNAVNPIILVGNRVAQSGAVKEAVKLAELLGSKVYASIYSEMNFPTSHPQFHGTIKLGYLDTKELLSSADALLIIGKLYGGYYMMSKPELRYFGPNTRIIHIDSDPREIGGTQFTEVPMIADPKIALSKLGEALASSMSISMKNAAKSRAASISREKTAYKKRWQERVSQRWDQTPMSPERMIAEIAQVIPRNTIITDDAITTSATLRNTIDFDQPGSIYGHCGGAIGWGIGGAMGVKLANPNRPVIAVVGDGSAMMTIQGFWTAADQNLAVLYIICNNQNYRVLKVNMNMYKTQILNQEPNQSQFIGMDFSTPLNIAGMAQANGIYGQRIENPSDLGPAVRRALDMNKPAVLDVIIDGSV